MPPHILMLAAVGVSLVAGYRMVHRAMKKRESDAKADVDSEGPRDLGSLEWDEASGAYRPRHH